VSDEAASRDFRARVTVGGQSASAPGTVRVDPTGLECGAGPTGPLRVDYDEVAAMERGDLSVTLQLFDGPAVVFDKGGSLDDLWDVVCRSFRARVSESLRFAPADPRHTFDARLTLEEAGGLEASPAQLSVVRLGLNYLAESGPCAQIPFGALGEPVFDRGSYEVVVPVEPGPAAPGGARLRIGKLGKRTDEFVELLRAARHDSLADTARCLAGLAPDVGAGPRAALASELAVGRMVSRARCEALAPGAWDAVWAAAAGPSRLPYRDALLKLAGGPESVFLGMRPYGGTEQPDDADAPGDAEPPADAAAAPPAVAPEPAEPESDAFSDSALPLVYAAAFLPGASPQKDVLVVEVLSERDHATYVYRVAPAPAGLAREAAGAWLAAVASHTMLSLDFKKEPLYMPEPELAQARGGLYRAALRRLSGMRELRGRLAGRAIHSSPAAWSAQLKGLMP
jgi:hypothetical protein